MWGSTIFLTLLCIYHVNADCYFHNPRGSNNRLDGDQRERKTDNRLFDSQNNARGGYNVGGDKNRQKDLNDIYQAAKRKGKDPAIRASEEEQKGPPGKMKYYEGSTMEVSWTNQHQCGGKNTNCELVLQYMCSANLRDGFINQRIRGVNRCDQSQDRKNRYCDTDRRFGMHEDTTHYTYCLNRERNKGLFTADQNLDNKETSQYTRQNNNGNRHGLECPEERDYYPHWSPSPWIDIVVMTNNIERCPYYKQESENVKPRFYCKIPDKTLKRLKLNDGDGGDNDRIPITQAECEAKTYDGEKAEWVQDTRPKYPAPECIFFPKSRDNHNGNGPDGFQNRYNWTIPNLPHKHCALRMRYNISTDDYDWSADSSLNGAGTVNLGERLGADNAEAKSRGFNFQGDPIVQPLKMKGSDVGKNLKLTLAINTAQFGRTFQDRSHEFEIMARPPELVGKKIHNMNVQGKRGNIVQVYPAVEYDYAPNRLEVNNNDYIHFQWTGSDNNPQNNNGNGKAGSDRSNIVLLKDQNYPEGTPGKPIAENLKNGRWGNSYPASLDDSKTLLGLPRDVRQYLAMTVSFVVPTTTPPVTPTSISPDEMRCNGQDHGCCTSSTPCNLGEGDCDKDSDCAGSLICNQHLNNCPWGDYDDCCMELPKGLRCNGQDDGCCTSTTPCNLGEGDCDNDSQCNGSLVCGTDNCPWGDKDDCCKEPVRNLKDLDDAHPYFNLFPQKVSKPGEFKYMCTRNNDFSNRSQKGKIEVKKGEATDANDATKELVDIDKLLSQIAAVAV